MQAFSIPNCKHHQQVGITHVCLSNNQLALICVSCITDSNHCAGHVSKTMPIGSFILSLDESNDCLIKAEEKAMKRYD